MTQIRKTIKKILYVNFFMITYIFSEYLEVFRRHKDQVLLQNSMMLRRLHQSVSHQDWLKNYSTNYWKEKSFQDEKYLQLSSELPKKIQEQFQNCQTMQMDKWMLYVPMKSSTTIWAGKIRKTRSNFPASPRIDFPKFNIRLFPFTRTKIKRSRRFTTS